MTIEIIEVKTVDSPSAGIPATRHVEVIITNGAAAYLWGVGGLPASGNLQTILDAREGELWAVAQQGGKAVDLYEFTVKRVLKAFALVMLDEINILRTQAGLSARTASQIDNALRTKLKAAP